MFLSRNNKNNVYPGKPQFCYIKMGFKGVKNYIDIVDFVMLPSLYGFRTETSYSSLRHASVFSKSVLF